MTMLDHHDSATAYLLKLPSQFSRRQALARCAEYLTTRHGLAPETASLDALQALAELENLNQRAFIDADASTSRVVVVRRPGLPPIALTVSDLLRLHAREAAASAPVDTH